jgi:hypothetical protein
MMLAMPYKVTKRRLEKDHPEWEWEAERNGLSWQYRGCQGKNKVLIKPFAVYCGFVEDDCTTEWRVDDGKKTQNYFSWCLNKRGC